MVIYVGGGEAGWGRGCTNLMGLPVRGRDRRIRRGLHEVCWVFEWYLCGGGGMKPVGGDCTSLVGLPVRGRDRRIRRGLHKVCRGFGILCEGGMGNCTSLIGLLNFLFHG